MGRPNELEAIFPYRGGNANLLAERLCAHSKAEHKRAVYAIAQIEHAKFGIMDFLGGPELFHAKLEDPAFEIEAVPLEAGFDFVPLIDSALEHVATRLHDDDYAYHHLAKSAQVHAGSVKRAANDITKSTKNGFQKLSVLSEAGTCCVAWYHRQDYYAIQTLLERGACHGLLKNRCELALQSILRRRAKYLNATSSDCRNLLKEE